MRSVVFLMMALCCAVAVADVEQLVVDKEEGEKTFIGYGTCFSVGVTPSGSGVWLTAGHNFEGYTSGYVELKGGTRHVVKNVRVSQTADVAVFETEYSAPSRCLGEPEVGSEVRVPGYGPLYAGGERSTMAGRIISTDRLLGENGEHAIQGDSGAPVLQGSTIVGVVVAYKTPATRRSDFADQKLWTQFVPTSQCRKLLVQYYSGGQCGPQGCPVWIPRARTYVPQSPQFVVNDPPAQPESLNYEKRIRDLEKRLLELESRPTEVILSRGRKTIDREVYPAGRPIVLDVDALK